MAIESTTLLKRLAAAKATIYTPNAGTVAKLMGFSLVNTDSVARTCNVYINDGSNSLHIIPVDLSLAAGEAKYFGGPWNLDAASSHVVEGDASAANVIHLCGSVEERS